MSLPSLENINGGTMKCTKGQKLGVVMEFRHVLLFVKGSFWIDVSLKKNEKEMLSDSRYTGGF